MSSTSRTPRSIPDAAHFDVRQDLVTRLLDDVNVLGEALVVALNEKDDVQAADLRASLDRYALAMGWSRDKFLPAIVAYANGRPGSDDDLFAPAFILRSIASDHPETAALLARVSQDVRAVLARL